MTDAVVAVVVVSVSYLFVTFAQVWWTGAHDAAQKVDVIVVLGAAQYDGRPSPQLQARLDHALELWNQGFAKRIVVTGGNKPGDRFTEAETSAKFLTERGIPAEAILREDAGTNTYDSLHTVNLMMDEEGWSSALVVTDPFHSLRCVLILERGGVTAYASATRTSPVKGANAFGKHLKETLGISAARILGFRRLLSITG